MTYQQTRGYFVNVCGHPVKAEPANMQHTIWATGGPRGVIFHYTVGCNDDIKGTLESNGFGGAHFCIGRDGTIRQYAPLFVATWHCFSASHYFYGIEHTAYPGTCELTDVQLQASAKLSAALVEYMKDQYNNAVPLEHKTGSPYLTPGFRDHRDLAGDGQNSHTDHLYRWTWPQYLAAVTGGASSDEMSDYEKGVAAFADAARNGNPDRIPDPGWPAEKKQGFRDARLLYNNPLPIPGPEGPQGPPGPSAAVAHTHNYSNTLSGTTDSGS